MVGRPDAGRHRSARGRRTPRTTRRRRTRRPWSGHVDAAAERGEPVAADGVDGQPEREPPQRQPHDATTTSSTISARGHEFARRTTLSPSSRNQPATLPPGRGRTSSAAPPQTNDIASVTTMSGTRVQTTSSPLTTPEREAHEPGRAARRRPRPRAGPAASARAAVTFVSAIIEPIERSMPPEITMIACAAAASPSGSAPFASVSRSNAPNYG